MIFNRKYKGLRHYEKIRDKLTIREEPKVEVKIEDNRYAHNATDDSISSLMGLLPMMIVVGIIAATISIIVGGLK